MSNLDNSSNKFHDLYRIGSPRLESWNYSWQGVYFVTVVTKDRNNFLGEIRNGEMKLSAMGEIVAREWGKTAEIRPKVQIDEWVIMPNHWHGIIVMPELGNDNIGYETHSNASLQKIGAEYRNRFGPQSNNLSAIIRGFKGATTKAIHLAGYPEFDWQARFHEHIVRDSEELESIRAYIRNNPVNWEIDNLDNPFPL